MVVAIYSGKSIMANFELWKFIYYVLFADSNLQRSLYDS